MYFLKIPMRLFLLIFILGAGDKRAFLYCFSLMQMFFLV